MISHYRCIVFLVLSLLSGTTALADVYTYEIRSIDADLGPEGCESRMRSAGEMFEQTSATDVIGSGCEWHEYLGSFTGKIVYRSENRTSVWSTESTTYGETIDLFYDRDQCEKALNYEVAFLRRNADFVPFWAQCDKVSNLGPPRFRSRIDAVGTTSIRRYETTAFLHYPLTHVNQVVQVLHDQAVDLGLTPVAWYQGPVNSLRGLSVAYYSEMTDTKQRLLSKSTLYYTTMTDCESAANVFNATRNVPWSGVAACSTAHPSIGFQLNVIWWGQAISPDAVLRTSEIPGSHPNLASCQNEARTLAEQLARHGEQVVGIICGRSSGSQSPTKMQLLTLASSGRLRAP
jgi:hypothetical protein